MKSILLSSRALLLFVLVSALGLAACADQDAVEPAVDADAETTPVAYEGTATLPTPAGTYAIDPVHSRAEFRVKHMGVSNVTGRFGDLSGQIVLDEPALGAMSATARIDAASIDTDNERRDGHLRSADFFDAENHPEITFVTTDVRPTGERTFVMMGDLTIRGTTRPVELEGEFIGAATTPDGTEKIGFEAEGEINRKDFGLNWNKVLETGGLVVGDEVRMMIQIEADRQADAAQQGS